MSEPVTTDRQNSDFVNITLNDSMESKSMQSSLQKALKLLATHKEYIFEVAVMGQDRA